MTNKSLTMVEQIFSRHLPVYDHPCKSGTRLTLAADHYIVNEMLGAATLPKIKQINLTKINPKIKKQKFYCFLDHGGIGTTPKYVKLHQSIEKFCKEQKLKLFPTGTGISHIVFPELGVINPGDIILGTDSHTTTHGAYNTYAQAIGASDLLEIFVRAKTWLEIPKSIYFKLSGKLTNEKITGKDIILYILGKYGVTFAIDQAIEYECNPSLPLADRCTIANMSAELGAKAAIFQYDKTLEKFFKKYKSPKLLQPVGIDLNAEYSRKEELAVPEIVPQIAEPHLPSNVKPVSEVGNVDLDQIYIGSCTNGRIEDLRLAAKILKGEKVKVKTLIVPGSHSVMLQAAKEGLLRIFLEAGCNLLYPSCNACFGGPVGLVGEEMTVLSTTNRNFKGRMGGNETTRVYLCSPPTAATSAITGRITDPLEGN